MTPDEIADLRRRLEAPLFSAPLGRTEALALLDEVERLRAREEHYACALDLPESATVDDVSDRILAMSDELDALRAALAAGKP
jgi:hypothetical protein